MKKIGNILLVLVISTIVFLLGFSHKISRQPYTLYNVYLDGELLGVIESKSELENYINSQANTIRENVLKYEIELAAIDTYTKYYALFDISTFNEKEVLDFLKTYKTEYNITDIDIDNVETYYDKKLYNYTESEINDIREYTKTNNIYKHVSNVYNPNGIEIRKTYTYKKDFVSVKEIYKKIIEKKSCTVAGYVFTIKSTNEELDDIVIYTIDDKIFSDAIENLITIFVPEDTYKQYKNNTQPEIVTTGSRIDNVYVEEDITYKAVNIPVEEKIYTDAKELSEFLLYGDNFTQEIVKVKVGDSIETLALNNKISVQEFLIFNSQYTSRDNLLVAGTDVVISNIDPKIQIVTESYEVVDKETSFNTTEQYDSNLTQGTILVTQEGKNGLERVTQNVKTVNGLISYVDPVDKQVLTTPIPKIINIGTKYVPNVGSTTSWGWPTNSGYTITSYYGYRAPIPGLYGSTNFHSGLDIAGTGYGSPVKATNNGTIYSITPEWVNGVKNSYGNHIIINHNNGYYTLYAHMSSFEPSITVGSTVTRDSIIGYVGCTGTCSGPHVHYEIRTCPSYGCITDPLRYYR